MGRKKVYIPEEVLHRWSEKGGKVDGLLDKDYISMRLLPIREGGDVACSQIGTYGQGCGMIAELENHSRCKWG